MIIILNKIFQKIRKKVISDLYSKAREGQAGLILILFIAVGLVLYAITLNWSRVAVVKALTIKAANSSSAAMSSYVASYGERYLQEQLGGRKKKCSTTSVISALIALFIVLIVVILCICQQWYSIALLLVLIACIAVMIANVIIQITVIQGGITRMWNSMMADSMSIQDQAVEKGVQIALQSMVSDPVEIPDFYDQDTDGFFGDLRDPADSSSANDYISRFAYFYTKRLQHLEAINYAVIRDFQAALKELLEKDPNNTGDTQGLFDSGLGIGPCSSGNPRPPAECDPCCVPQYERDGEGNIALVETDPGPPPVYGPVPIRPICCDDRIASCSFHTAYESYLATGNSAYSCEERSPYYTDDGDPFNDYGLIYDPMYENSLNNDRTHPDFVGPYFLSIKEKFGTDDEHSSYNVDEFLPRWHTFYHDYPSTASVSRQTLALIVPEFRYEDVTGVFKPPLYPLATHPEPDDQTGIFSFFHKVKDFGVRLSSLTYIDRQCHWCDPRHGGAAICGADVKDPQLTLPNAPGIYNGDWCLDNSNVLGAGEFPQIADVVVGRLEERL
jgi:hypothetical protein